MTNILVIGAGPAAAAVALAARSSGQCDVTVIDVGERLDGDRRALLETVADVRPSDWPQHVREELTIHPVPEVEGELSQKRQFGSDFPFRNYGQLDRYSVVAGGNRYPVSGAFGGFSNVWGAQIMPFSRETIDEWPIAYEELCQHYSAILAQIPFAGRSDDYADMFPLFGEPSDLPPLAPALATVESRYAERSRNVRARGVTVGAARLALRAADCVRCGLCLTGCPYSLIYSASQTLDQLIEAGSVRYRAGVLAFKVGEDSEGPWADVRDLETGETERLRADRVFVACGGIGSTRLVLGSARPDVRQVELAESVQMVMPFLSRRSGPDPASVDTFTLNQLNLLIEYGRPGLDMAHFHLYPYNPGFDDALPAVIRKRPRLATAVLQRTVAGLGYLPSWDSPRVRLAVGAPGPASLPSLTVSAAHQPGMRRAIARVMARLLAAAPALDLWPGVPALSISGPGKSYHFGGAIPHVSGPPREGRLETDSLGRLAEWDRVHVVDGAVFPTVPATTFTLTVMANAHRIATTALEAR